jgi:hypothetical protein
MPTFDLDRARTIVDRAQATFAAGPVSNPYEPFEAAGAKSRLEAIQSVLLSIADYYSHARHNEEQMPDFIRYSNFSGGIVLRLIYESGAAAEEQKVLGRTESVDSLVGFLKWLDAYEQEFWPSVHERLEFDYQAVLDSL